MSVGNERSKNAKRFSKSEWMTAWKALRSLRSRQPKLKRLKLTGVVGPWCEILNLGAIFGVGDERKRHLDTYRFIYMYAFFSPVFVL